MTQEEQGHNSDNEFNENDSSKKVDLELIEWTKEFAKKYHSALDILAKN